MTFFQKSLTACTCLLTTGILAVSPASADGLYVGLGGGGGWASDSDIDGTGIDTSADYDAGPVIGLSLGYAFADGLRGEVELANRWNDADSIGSSNGSGDVTALSAMINGFYDFNMDGSFTPYVGAGIGGAQVEANGLSPVGSTSVDDKDTVLAYQAMVGVAYSLSDALSLTADYRYFATDDLGYSAASGTSVDQEYAHQSVMLGIRFDLGSTESTMPMVGEDDTQMPETTTAQATGTTNTTTGNTETQPAPEPDVIEEAAAAGADTETAAAPALPQFPRAYRILFDWNDARLDSTSLNVIRQAAENARNGGITRIEATGHADTSGTKSFNMKLSRKRAEAVMQALLNMGISGEQIDVHWHGEAQPLVATGDNVREVQNRRVEIIFADN